MTDSPPSARKQSLTDKSLYQMSCSAVLSWAVRDVSAP